MKPANWIVGVFAVATAAAAGAAPVSCIQRDTRGDFLGWADYPHCLVDSRTQSTVRWLDDWFGDPDEEALARAYVRAITDFRVTDRGDLDTALRLRAKVNLPKLHRRLSLVLEDERPESDNLRDLTRDNDTSLALRFLNKAKTRLRLETDLGVRSGPDVFARVRYRDAWSLSPDDVVSLRQTVRYGAKEKLRAINELTYTHAFSALDAGSVYHTVDYQQENFDDGLFWGRGLLYARTLSADASWSTGIGQEGVSRPRWQAQTQFVWLRWRQRFLRDWLFYELEPRVTQSRERDWRNDASLTLRLEVQFGYDYHSAERQSPSRP